MTAWSLTDHRGADVVALDDVAALDARIVGAKAANLAKSLSSGLPVLEGFAIPVAIADRIASTGAVPTAVRDAYERLSAAGTVPVVVRSSSPNEDTAASSQAGQFTSVVDIRSADACDDAVRTVSRSGNGHPMAVLVQRHLDPALAGVAFGVDPVSGRDDRVVVAAVSGGPQQLVAGEVTGDRYELTPRGRLVRFEPGDGGTRLDARSRRALTSLVRDAAAVHGGPQDVEWATTDSGSLRLLQTRPVTTTVARPVGPRYGPGPVAETFPLPLGRLEQELWLPPLRAALVEVAVLTGRAPRRRLAGRPLVVSPGGWAAVDLELFEGRRRHGVWAALDPVPKLRRLAAAWRTGRLVAAMDAIGSDVVTACDAALRAVPELDGLPDEELLTILHNAGAALTSLHAHEILAGALLPQAGPTGAEVALHALRAARRSELTDSELGYHHPEVLAIVAPHIGPRLPYPADPPDLSDVTVGDLSTREALRLRVRWMQELTARVATELGRRLELRGIVATADEVRHLDVAGLGAALRGHPPTVVPLPVGAPLPASFRLTTAGSVVAEEGAGDGVGAGGGRGVGPVHHGDEPPRGSVLVVTALEPGLAVWLPRLAGLVAETGSPLSHLAILAREHGVPTVVGLAGAGARWAPGEVVVVDGTTGDVAPLPTTEVPR